MISTAPFRSRLCGYAPTALPGGSDRGKHLVAIQGNDPLLGGGWRRRCTVRVPVKPIVRLPRGAFASFPTFAHAAPRGVIAGEGGRERFSDQICPAHGNGHPALSADSPSPEQSLSPVRGSRRSAYSRLISISHPASGTAMLRLHEQPPALTGWRLPAATAR